MSKRSVMAFMRKESRPMTIKEMHEELGIGYTSIQTSYRKLYAQGFLKRDYVFFASPGGQVQRGYVYEVREDV